MLAKRLAIEHDSRRKRRRGHRRGGLVCGKRRCNRRGLRNRSPRSVRLIYFRSISRLLIRCKRRFSCRDQDPQAMTWQAAQAFSDRGADVRPDHAESNRHQLRAKPSFEGFRSVCPRPSCRLQRGPELPAFLAREDQSLPVSSHFSHGR
jgi:hypothetical protein